MRMQIMIPNRYLKKPPKHQTMKDAYASLAILS